MDLTPYITPEQMRIQARLEPDDASLDPTLTLYAKAAFRAIEAGTGRKLFPPDAALPADAPENALQATEDIQLAMLMMVAHWFDNPSAVSSGAAVVEVPLGYRHLTDPHKWYSL